MAKTPREVSGTQDITGGLPRVTEIFEARKPKDPAVIAEIDGTVEILGEKRRGKRTIVVKSESGIEREHLVSHGKHLRVHTGSFVRAGESLVDGPLVPHDILRISGEEAVQQYLVREIQNVYRSQRVEINDKHIEIIVSSMLRKVRVESVGRYQPAARLGDGQIRVPRRQPGVGQVREDRRKGRLEFRGGRDRPRPPSSNKRMPKSKPWAAKSPNAASRKWPPPARSSWASPRPPCKARVSSRPPVSRKPPKCYTEAALAGKIDRLVGLKENVILGHLIPAGTGFRTYQDGEVRIRPAALEGLIQEKEDVLARHFPLLEEAAPSAETSAAGKGGEGDGSSKSQPIPQPALSPLDALFMGEVDEEEAEKNFGR